MSYLGKSDKSDKSRKSKRDKDSVAEQLRTHVRWFETFDAAMRTARRLAERDRDYYDGYQWTEAELQELDRRGQPATVINRIASKVNIIRGTEVRTRTDPSAKPRTPAHEDSSPAVTDALRYVSDAENFPRIKGRVADEVLVEGCAAIVVDVESDKKLNEVHVKHRRVPWDRYWFDHHSREPDFSDAKYQGTVTWMDREDALETYRNNTKSVDNIEQVIDAAVGEGNLGEQTFEDRPNELWYDSERDRIRVVEVYFKKLVNGVKEYHTAHYTKVGYLIEPAKVAFVDDQGRSDCPIVATSAYVDRQNRRYGVVRNMISPQDEINKRRSKSLHLLNSTLIIMDEHAVDDVEAARAQVARPDGVVVIANADARFEVDKNLDLAATHFQLLAEAKAEIDAAGPNTAAATDTAVRSGRDRQFMQTLASMELEPIFDNIREWQREVFRKTWYRIRQYWPTEKWLRVRDDEKKSGYRFVALNRVMTKAERMMELVQEGMPPEETFAAVGFPTGVLLFMQAQQAFMGQLQAAQQQGLAMPDPQQVPMLAFQQVVGSLPQLRETMKLNDVESLMLDIIIDESPDTATINQEEFEKMAGLAQAGIPVPPEVLIEMSNTRHKQRLLEMIEQSKSPNPAVQQQAELQVAQLQADIQKTQAQAQEAGARAAKYASEAQTDPIEVDAKATKAQAEALEASINAGKSVGDLSAAMSGIQPGVPLA